MQDIFDAVDATAKRYPIKALADDIGKAESTLRNELNRQVGYKFGLETFDLILRHTEDLSPLIKLNRRHNLTAFKTPKCTPNNTHVMEAAAKVMVETGESMRAAGETLADGKLTADERERLKKEVQDVIDAALELLGCLAT